jgi:hypothetical protein
VITIPTTTEIQQAPGHRQAAIPAGYVGSMQRLPGALYERTSGAAGQPLAGYRRREPERAVDAAVARYREIVEKWPDSKPLSSRNGRTPSRRASRAKASA